MDKVEKTDSEWRAALSDLAYHVTREHGTERPFTHDNFPDTPGTYRCVCCDAPLFDHLQKFEAHCGWPAFSAPIDEEIIGVTLDERFNMRRTEVHCARCDAHLGHVFPDGPPPSGLRYCINGVALRFEPEEA